MSFFNREFGLPAKQSNIQSDEERLNPQGEDSSIEKMHSKLPTDDKKLTSEDSSVEKSRDLNSFSSFERLPNELVWEIIEIVPETALNLRLTSRLLKFHVDEYALRKPRLTLVDELEMCSCDSAISTVVHTTKGKWELLELRRKLGGTMPVPQMLNKRVNADGVVALEYIWDTKSGMPDCLKAYIGKSIGKATLCDTNLLNFSKLLEGVQFRRLEFTSAEDVEVSDEAFNSLFEFCKSRQIEQLILQVGEVTVSDPVQVLLYLSSQFRSIHIAQADCTLWVDDEVDDDFINGKADDPYAGSKMKYFFGLRNADWGNIFVTMFSNKMDKLRVTNRIFPYYLEENCADFLNEHLQMLGKEVWFEGEYLRKDRGANAYREVELKIKHTSRLNEMFEQL